MDFGHLSLHAQLLASVRNEGYQSPTPIQARAIPLVLSGRDLLACAQTGTGKTAAFALPILQRLMASPRRGPEPRALVLAPTRELAAQVAESFATYSSGTGLRLTAVFGGVKQSSQVRVLRAGVDVLVAAPGRLLDLMGQRLVSLRQIEVLVLDEADRMLDMGFIRPIRQIAGVLPRPRQTLMFSATMPEEIRRLARELLVSPAEVAVAPVSSTVDAITQDVYFVEQGAKLDLLKHVLAAPAACRVIVFTRTKHGANKVVGKLRQARIAAEVIHGNKSQSARQRALESFKGGASRVLVATDVAARGLDVDGISHVVNFDVPHEPESYVHRIGRTGRAGAVGTALSFCGEEERSDLRQIERLIKRTLNVVRGHPFSREVRGRRAEGSRAADGLDRVGADRRGPRTRRPGPRGAIRGMQAATGGDDACIKKDRGTEHCGGSSEPKRHHGSRARRSRELPAARDHHPAAHPRAGGGDRQTHRGGRGRDHERAPRLEHRDRPASHARR